MTTWYQLIFLAGCRLYLILAKTKPGRPTGSLETTVDGLLLPLHVGYFSNNHTFSYHTLLRDQE